MKTTVAIAVLAWTASTAFAHGDAHVAKKPAYDAAKVEARAFGREGGRCCLLMSHRLL
jgi:hypothetical protein